MHMEPWEAFLFLFGTIGPLKVTLVCATMTADATPDFLKQVAYRSVTIALAVCIVFAVLGEAILNLFKVSVPAFQIGGGIIVLLFSLEMVKSEKTRDTDATGDSRDHPPELSPEIAAFPLAIPLMASVSGLVAIISLLPREKDVWAVLFLSCSIVAIMAINYVCLRYCQIILKVLGLATLRIVNKMLGVILTALAVELMLKGFSGLGLITAAPR
jgi:multiple antibiotic resistance protein